jgi:polysaccharide export outer membrane protein
MLRFVFLELFLAGGAALLSAQQAPSGAQVNADQQSPTTVYNLPSQPVGADDLLAVTVYDSPELSRTVRVGADGSIRLPMLKQKISVVGKLPNQIETLIATEFSDEAVLVDPVVTVSVAEYKSRPVSVIGAVKSPLTFQALPGTTLLDAITKAQGLTDDAGADILVTREVVSAGGKPTEISQRIPAKDLLEKPDSVYNLPLSGGEQIRVPEAGKIFVVGTVKKPGSFSMHDAGDPTVLKAIALSDGLDAFPAKIAYIYRKEAGKTQKDEIPIELAKIVNRTSPDLSLQPDDVLYIPQNNGKKITIGAIERVIGVGSSSVPAVIYTTR